MSVDLDKWTENKFIECFLERLIIFSPDYEIVETQLSLLEEKGYTACLDSIFERMGDPRNTVEKTQWVEEHPDACLARYLKKFEPAEND